MPGLPESGEDCLGCNPGATAEIQYTHTGFDAGQIDHDLAQFLVHGRFIDEDFIATSRFFFQPGPV